jgi:hypothetical protein
MRELTSHSVINYFIGTRNNRLSEFNSDFLSIYSLHTSKIALLGCSAFPCVFKDISVVSRKNYDYGQNSLFGLFFSENLGFIKI